MSTRAGANLRARPFLLAAALLSAAVPARAGNPSDEEAWLRLLHYKGGASDARPGAFFLAPTGAKDARAEYEADVKALSEPDPAARCRFPARTAWLAGRLGLNAAVLLAPCADFKDWAGLMGARGVSLVFASAYMNNPSSMFGHTFLRMERAGPDRLLDNTLNFAAETADTNGVFFAVKGLLGLYPGKYAAMPYYMKVAEYNDVENRDLWEYRLALSSAEVDDLVAHAWEMGRAVFPYYFFSKNCSYQLMPALEAAAPRLTLMPGSPPIVGPIDTLLAVVNTPGLVKEVVYRPSHATVMGQRLALLTRAERGAAWAYAKGRAEEGDGRTQGLAPERRALVLDAAHDYILYEGGFSPDVPAAVREKEHAILVRRGRLDAPTADLPRPAWAFPPEAGHLRHRLNVGGGVERGAGFAELSWRPGLHDMLDRPAGFVPDNSIWGLGAAARYDGAAKRFYLRDLTLVDILSLTPWDAWTRKPSWAVQTGLDTAFEAGVPAPDALYYEGRAGTGLSARLPAGVLVSALGVGEFGAGAVFRTGARVGGGLRLGASTDLSRTLRLVLEGGLKGYVVGDPRPNHSLKAGLNWAPVRDRALRAVFLMQGHHREGSLNALVYY